MMASPWQSSYINDSHMLFGESSAAAKRAYAKFNFQVTDNHLPGDHFSLITSFLSKLCEFEGACLAGEGEFDFDDTIEAHKQFLDKNLLSWIDKFVNNMNDAKSVFYLAFASMTKVVGEFDKSVLESID